jgi:hypothetical protein
VLASGPLAYWRLGESSGSVAHDGVSGYDGTYLNATLGQPGYSAIDSDTAVNFGGVNSYVGSIPGTPGTGVNFQGHANFTIEFWAKGPAGQGDESSIIAKGNGSSGTSASEQFAVDVAGGNYRFFTRGGGNSLYEADATIGPNDTWQHIVAVYDDLDALGGGSMMYLYVNGELSGTGAPRGPGLRASSVPVSIGAKRLGNDPAYDGYFTGTIDEVAVYPFAMSAATVLAHYGAAYGSSLAPVIDIQPKAITNYVGLPVTLTVAAHGTVPLTYQWKKDGVDIGGATAYSYTIPSVAPGDVGDYTVGVTNGINPGQLSTAAHLAVLPAPTSPPAIPGLVLHLPFDNNVSDTSGRGNNGAGVHLVGDRLTYGTNYVTVSNVVAQTYVPGKLGSGLHFVTTALDGSGGTNWDNYYVSLNDRPDFHFGADVNFTVAFWVKNTDAVAAQWGDLPFLTTTVGSTFGTGLVLAWTYGTGGDPWIGGWAYSIYDAGGNGVGGRGDQGAIDDGEWHHLAYVFDRIKGATVYKNGVPATFHKQAGTAAYNAGDIDTGNWLTIGQDPTGLYPEAGSGALDDLGVWRKALTPLEVAAIYTAGVNNKSFVGAPDSFYMVQYGGSLKIYWNIGVLQSANNVNGPYTDVPSATSPYTVSPAGARAFFKVRK